jgi:hypothetical protein
MPENTAIFIYIIFFVFPGSAGKRVASFQDDNPENAEERGGRFIFCRRRTVFTFSKAKRSFSLIDDLKRLFAVAIDTVLQKSPCGRYFVNLILSRGLSSPEKDRMFSGGVLGG